MKQFKRIIATVMAVSLCAGLAVTASATNTYDNQQLRTPADDNTNTPQTKYVDTNTYDKYKITIKGGDIDAEPGVTQNGGAGKHEYRAYQIFTGDVNKNATKGNKNELSITGWGKDVNGAALLEALQADDRFLWDDDNDATTPQVNAFKDATGFAGVASVISKWKDGASTGKEDSAKVSPLIDYFAEVVYANLDPDAQTAGSALTWDDTAKQFVSGDLDEGYYLVKDLGKAADQDDFISKNIIELLGGDATIAPKGSIPKVDKGVIDKDSAGISGDPGTSQPLPNGTTENAMPDKFQEGDAVEANIGDTVYYTIKGTVSNMIQDYTTYEFAFNDKMSKGLSFGTTASAEARSALNTSNQDAQAAIDAAQARVDAADAAYAALHTQFGGTDEAGVTAADATAVSNAQSAVDDAQAAVTAAELAVANAGNDVDKAAAQAVLDTKVNELNAAKADLKAAQDAQKEHKEAYTAAKAEQTKAGQELTKAQNVKTTRESEIDAAKAANTINDAEAALLKADKPDLSDQTATDKYNEALNKVLKSGIDALKTAGNIKVYLYNDNNTAADLTDDTKLAEINPSDYAVTVEPGKGINGGDLLKIYFEDLKTITDTSGNSLTVKAGDYLVAVYSAVVNEDAIVGNPGNVNEVDLEYSRDPDSGEKGTSKSKPNDAVVFTFELDINKIDKNSKERLTDAGFFLFKTINVTDPANAGNFVEKYQYAKLTDKGDGTYVFNGWTDPVNKPAGTTLTDAEYEAIKTAGGVEMLTENNGHFEVKGLQSGAYKVMESTVPNGYNPEDRGQTFDMNLQAEFAELTSEEFVDCINDYNPDYVSKTTYTAEEQAAGVDKMYVDAYGDPTNDKYLRVKNDAYTPGGTAEKWVATRTDNGDGTFTNDTFTNTDTDALKETMTLKTYKVSKLTLNGEGEGAGLANTENGTGMIDVLNSLDVVLPETGGIGTTIFYIVGGILVVGAAVVMITRKRVEG